MALRVTKTAVEVITRTNPNLRVTKTAIEVLTGAGGGGSGIIIDPVYAFPASITPTSTEWTFATNNRVFVSPISQHVQTARRGPERWLVRVSCLNLVGVERAKMQAFLLQLTGRRYTFTMRDHAYVRRGSGLGAPLVKGGDQLGDKIETDGWTPSSTGVLLAGDLIQVGKQIVMVVADISSDSVGYAELPVRPAIRIPPADNSAIETATPVGLFRLATPDISWSQGPGPVFSDFVFAAEEVLHA